MASTLIQILLDHGDENSRYQTRTVTVDGQFAYQDKIPYEMIRSDRTPIGDLDKWLLGQKETQSCCDVCCYGGKSSDLFWNTWFKTLNFKQKLIYVLFKKLLLSEKTTARQKVVRFYMDNKVNEI